VRLVVRETIADRCNQTRGLCRRESPTPDGARVARIVSDLLLFYASTVRERLGRYSGHELEAPPFRFPFILLALLRLFIRVLSTSSVHFATVASL